MHIVKFEINAEFTINTGEYTDKASAFEALGLVIDDLDLKYGGSIVDIRGNSEDNNGVYCNKISVVVKCSGVTYPHQIKRRNKRQDDGQADTYISTENNPLSNLQA